MPDPDQPPLPLPAPTADTAPYWDAAAEGRLLLRRCRRTGALSLGAAPPPEPPEQTEWVEATGRGHVHSFTVAHIHPDAAFNRRTPYVVALIDLEEGVRMLAHVVGPSALDVAVGDAVRCVFEARGGGFNVPQFLREQD